MRAWTYLFFSLLGLSALISCSKPVGQTVPAEPTHLNEKAAKSDGSAKPFCTIEMSPYKVQEETLTLQAWSLKIYGLKSLTSRLLMITDGKVNVSNELTYIWNKWEPSTPSATGQMVLVVHDGSAFGAKEKRLPTLGMVFQGGPKWEYSARNSGLFLEGNLKDKFGSSWPWNLELGKAIIFSQIYMAPDKFQIANISSSIESAIATSKEGRPVLAVEVEAKVQD
jgi:hypothetical protein